MVEFLVSLCAVILTFWGTILGIAGIFCTLIGMLTLYHLIQSQKRPADQSNRINHIRLWWFALTRPEEFAEHFPWMKNDEWDNINGK